MGAPAHRRSGLVFVATAAVFALAALRFNTRVTDISALRVLDGDIPYRDFWTMYAPGSFVVLAGAFGLLGRELLVSNLLGILAASSAALLFYQLAVRVAGPDRALVPTAVFVATFAATGYHVGLTSFPPAMLLVLSSLALLCSRVDRSGSTWAIVPGLLVGTAAVFKHDVAAYAAIASAAGIAIARGPAGRAVAGPLLVYSSAALVAPGLAAIGLVALGAGADSWQDLVVFPLRDFKHVRSEDVPWLPPLGDDPIATARSVIYWSRFQWPLAIALIALPVLVRAWRTLTLDQRLLAGFCVVAFGIHSTAARVQLNTHAISLAGWASLLGATALWATSSSTSTTRRTRVAMAVAAAWMVMMLAEPSYMAVRFLREGSEWAGLPGLRGIRVSHEEARWMRSLAAALADAAPPDAPLLLVSSRNDIVVHASSAPFWLSRRRPATRHHELHPGVTDTPAVQARMIADLSRERWPVVVREHRFPDSVLETAKSKMRTHVPVGAPFLDEWVARRYTPGSRYGMYELMRPLRSW
jgi:hypothetical protein